MYNCYIEDNGKILINISGGKNLPKETWGAILWLVWLLIWLRQRKQKSFMEPLEPSKLKIQHLLPLTAK